MEAILESVLSIFSNWGLFVGAGALIAIVINVLKYFGVVKDGEAPRWNAALNLGLIVVFVAVQLIWPGQSLQVIDTNLGLIAAILSFVFGYVLEIGSSKVTHAAVSGLPVIGKSYTDEFMKDAIAEAKKAEATDEDLS